ncbi:hypothetical protein [Corynebacterium auriscanis]|uniref:hypothetical protein n=1 Tax=Corynebacterium auriscanis TaxID=99807 RepID=UPI0024ACA290|nr:hypothetical protein [Corynebacterium auriscanis]
MSYTPDPAVVAVFDLIANHRHSALHAAQATGCTERALRDYLTNRGEFPGAGLPYSPLPAQPAARREPRPRSPRCVDCPAHTARCTSRVPSA